MGIYVSEINMPKGEGSKLVLQIFPNGEVYDEHGIRLGIANWAEAIPAADVREVVLCKNCYAYRKDKELAEAAYLNGEQYCALLRCEMPEDGFCWYGCPNCGADMREES